MARKAKAPPPQYGAGPLTNCPYQMLDYQCCKCKGVFSFVSGVRCSCERSHKFHAKPIIVGGLRFDGFREGQRFSKLMFLQTKELLGDLVVHPTFPIVVNEKKVCVYEADFQYEFEGVSVIEDVKGVETAVFKLKKKLFAACYPELNLVLI